MRTRTCFVSNSSTSSYICELCEEEAVGMDISLQEAEMMSCVNEHIVCESCLSELGYMTKIEELQEEDEKSDIRWEVPEECCPICQFKEPSFNDLRVYLHTIYKISPDVVFAEVKKLNKRRKKLYDNEYVEYVCKEKNIDIYALLKELRGKFKTYSEFYDSF